MFGGHLPELVVLLVAALVIFGPKRLPEIGGAMGKGIREFKKGTIEKHEDPDGDVHLADKVEPIAVTGKDLHADQSSTVTVERETVSASDPSKL